MEQWRLCDDSNARHSHRARRTCPAHEPDGNHFERFPQRRPKITIRSAALKRGYQAFFEIHRGKLVLKDIKVQSWTLQNRAVMAHDGSQLSRQSSLMGTHCPLIGLQACWCFQRGQFEPMYTPDIPPGTRTTLLEIREGQVMEERNLNAQEYDAFTAQQFAAYRETKDYRERYARMEKEGKSPAFIEAYLKDTVLEKTKTFLKTADTP